MISHVMQTRAPLSHGMQTRAPLSHVLVGETTATCTALVVHGILGSARNWLSFIRRHEARTPGWRYVLVDLRNHGDSHDVSAPHTLTACADDLHHLSVHLGLSFDAVIGHSFGGKVVLEYLRRHATAATHTAFVLDSNPGVVNPLDVMGDPHEVIGVVSALRTFTRPIASRVELTDGLRALGFSEAMGGWMTTNLRPLPSGGFDFKFNLDAVEQMLASYFSTDSFDVLASSGDGRRVYMILGGKSDRVREDDRRRLEALSPRVSVHVLPEAGHWVHVDDPEGLSSFIAAKLMAPRGSQA